MTESDIEVGPVDYVVIEFPHAKFTGEGVTILADLQARGIIRILDAAMVMRNEDDSVTALEITDIDGDGVNDLLLLQGYASGLLDEDDLEDASHALERGSAAAVIVYENTWAGPFVSAMRRAGAEVVASGRIPASDLIEVLDALESADAGSAQ